MSPIKSTARVVRSETVMRVPVSITVWAVIMVPTASVVTPMMPPASVIMISRVLVEVEQESAVFVEAVALCTVRVTGRSPLPLCRISVTLRGRLLGRACVRVRGVGAVLAASNGDEKDEANESGREPCDGHFGYQNFHSLHV